MTQIRNKHFKYNIKSTISTIEIKLNPLVYNNNPLIMEQIISHNSFFFFFVYIYI